ncbi:MAG: ROK family protein [Oscillospiraceae bacterium]|nr:ROK family protein [Oscillospiraceae bacterium]
MKIGIDLGGTNIAGGLVADDGTLVYKTSIPTVTESEEALLEAIVKVIETVRENAGDAEITAVGIGVPGHADDRTGIVVYCNNIPFANTDLAGYVKEKTGFTCSIGNDANAAALAEVLFGSAKEFENAVMITLGTGIGAGIIINNKIFSGVNGAAGEIGHICLYPEGIECNCGRRGCFELYGSATALVRQTREAIEKHPESKMCEIAKKDGKVNGKTAFDAMRAGDEAGKEVVNQYVRYLATGVLDVINFFCPEAIIFGGGVAKEGETLLSPIREIVKRECYSDYGKQTKFLTAVLGNDAGIIGAAFLGE